MGSRGLAALICLALAVALVAAGCDGGGEPQVGGPEDQALLDRMALTVDDLPPGLQRVAAAYSTNQEAAEGSANPTEELGKLDFWGRRLGYQLDFIRSPGETTDMPVRGLRLALSLYETDQGAGLSFDADVATARAADWRGSNPQLTEIEVTEVERSGIGDGRYWLHITGFETESPTVLFVDDQVVFRVGRVRAYLRVQTAFDGATDRELYMNQVEQWARLASDRIAAALAAGEQS